MILINNEGHFFTNNTPNHLHKLNGNDKNLFHLQTHIRQEMVNKQHIVDQCVYLLLPLMMRLPS